MRKSELKGIHAVLKAHRGAMAALARELNLDPASVSNYLAGRVHLSVINEMAIARRAVEIARKQKAA